MIDNEEDSKRKRDRSPSFPYVSLREAVQRTEEFHKIYGRHAARVAQLSQPWNYSPSSSSLLRVVAALKMYGLIDEQGAGADRKVNISELGARIAADKRPGVRDAAIRQAFSQCEILVELNSKWGARRPPDDACLSELHLDMRFTEEAAKKLISVYDDSVTYANMSAPDSVQQNAEQVAEPYKASAVGKGDSGEPSDVGEKPTAKTRGGATMSEAVYPLSEGSATLIWPKEISAKSAKKLKKWLQLMLDDVEESAQEAGASDVGKDKEG